MFILRSVENQDIVHFLYCGSKLLISRIKGHVVLPNDKSVSREHAEFYISHDIKNIEDCTQYPEVILEDLGSRYGTFLNEGIAAGEKLAPYTPHRLCDGDTIRFGLLSNVWKLSYKQIVACSSLVEDLTEVKYALQCLGGHILRNWTSDCNLLVMSDLLLTAKAVCALSSCSNIVSPQYLISLLAALQKKTPHPIPLNFIPPLKEMCIGKDKVSFVPNEKRKSLFSGKVFLFSSSKSMNKLKCPILLSEGAVELLVMENVHLLAKHNNILISQPDSKSKSSALLIDKANDILNKNSLTSIPESDIGLAIVHVSTAKYCNPRFKVNNLLSRKEGNEQPPRQTFEIYATETQYYQTSLAPPSRNIVTETGQLARPSTSSVTSSNPSTSHPTKSPTTILPSLPNHLPLLPNMLPSLPNQLPSLPAFSHRDDFMEDTCMSTQTLILSPVKVERRESTKRERIPSDKLTSPVHKKRNLGRNANSLLPVTLNTDITGNKHTDTAEGFTEPSFNHNSMHEESLFLLEDSLPFTAGDDTKREIKTPMIEVRATMETESVEVFKCPEPLKRSSPTSPILESRIKRTRSNDTENCSSSTQVSSTQETIRANPFALPFASSRRQRKVIQPITTEDKILDKPTLEDQTSFRAEVDVNANTTTKLNSPMKSEITQPFIATQIKTEECIPSTSVVNGEKSLVVIEVVSLVKYSTSNVSVQDASNSTAVIGNNFKRFRKSWNGSCSGMALSLPRIIGGQDLVVSIDENPQKEYFLASQQHPAEPVPPPQLVTNDRQIENEFNLPMPKRARTRVR